MKCLWLFTGSIRSKSDDSKHRNIAFSSSRNAALIECYSTSIKFHQCTLSELYTQIFTFLDVLACVSIHCADHKQHSNPVFLTKSFDNTLQTCVDIANEYLQAYNIGGCVKNHLFWSLHECKCAVYTMVLLTIVHYNSNYFLGLKFSLFT